MLSLLGVRPILGRTHAADDAFPMDPKQFGNPDAKLPPNKVVLTYGLWQRRLAATPRSSARPSSWTAGARS